MKRKKSERYIFREPGRWKRAVEIRAIWAVEGTEEIL